MNQTQKKYLIKRVDEILNQKIQALRSSLSTPSLFLSDEELLRAMKEGRFSVKETFKRSGGYLFLRDFVIFHDEVQPQFDKEAFEEGGEQLRRRAQELKDELMLGSDTEALARLREFEQMETP